MSDIHDLHRQPIPVNLEHTDLKAHLESAISSTYLHLNAGTCTSVKIGTTGMPAVKLLQNLRTALPEIVKRLAPAKRRRQEDDGEEDNPWGNIQSLMIKTSESASLPIWSCLLGSGEGGRWDGLVAEQVEMEVNEEESNEPPKTSAKKKVVRPSLTGHSDISEGKRKKRAAEESKDEPKKKKKKSVETDEVTSKINGLTIEKAALGEKAKTEGKTTATHGSVPVLSKTKRPSSKSAALTVESARKPKKINGEKRATRNADISLPLANVTKPPTPAKSDATITGKKAKSKTSHVEALEPPKTRKPKVEKKDTRKEKVTKVISTPNPTGPALQARENDAKPLKSAIKSFSLPEGIREKKTISFDLSSEKERRGKKIGGKLSSKERLIGRGPRNA